MDQKVEGVVVNRGPWFPDEISIGVSFRVLADCNQLKLIRLEIVIFGKRDSSFIS